jgi:hypothetical protein
MTGSDFVAGLQVLLMDGLHWKVNIAFDDFYSIVRCFCNNGPIPDGFGHAASCLDDVIK